MRGRGWIEIKTLSGWSKLQIRVYTRLREKEAGWKLKQGRGKENEGRRKSGREERKGEGKTADESEGDVKRVHEKEGK